MDAIIPFSGLLILALSWLTTRNLLPRIRKHNLSSGRLDQPNERKTQVAAVPYGAGLSCVIGILTPVLLGGALLVSQRFFGWPSIIETHSEGLASKLPLMLAILGGAAILAFMGRRDDTSSMGVGVRLCIQVAVALTFATFGARATLFMDAPALQVALTVAWILFVTNAINFIDNTDGVMPSVAACVAAGILCIALLDGQLFVAAFALALMGSLIGVIPFNWHRASVYMGDEGSMPVGFLLATLSIVLTTTTDVGSRNTVAPFLIPPLLLAVPLIDASWVISRRILVGKSPFRADQDHLAHALGRQGWQPPRIAAFAAAYTLNFSAMAVFVHGDSTLHNVIAVTLCLPHVAFLMKCRRTKST